MRSNQAVNQVPEITDEQLIRDHIPHYQNIQKTGRQGNGLRQISENFQQTVARNIDEAGNIAGDLVFDMAATKGAAYADIQQSRSYNTNISYRSKQVEFLRFCHEEFYNQHLISRYQATGDKLLLFLYKRVSSLLVFVCSF